MSIRENAVDADALTPLQLAYVGDAVYDLLVRTHLLRKDRKLRLMHTDATARVNAAAQARALEAIAAMLTEEESDLVRRSRNAHAKHAAPKSSTCAEYVASTALEALFGYLYLSGREERMRMLFHAICDHEQEVVHA